MVSKLSWREANQLLWSGKVEGLRGTVICDPKEKLQVTS